MGDDPDVASNTTGEATEQGVPDLVGRIAKGGGIGFVGRIGSKFLGVLLQVVLTRFLGPSDYGKYVLGLSVAKLTQRFAQLGLGQGAIRFGSVESSGEGESRLAEFVFLSFVASALSGVGIAAILYVFASPLASLAFDDPAMARVLRLFSLAIPFYVLLELCASYFQAFERIDSQQLLTSGIRPVVNILLVAGAFSLGFRLSGAIGAFLAAGMVSSAVGLYILFRIHDAPFIVGRVADRSDVLVRLLRYSLPMMFIAMSFDIAMRADRLMLGMFIGSESVGIYNVAAMVSLQFGVVISSLITIFKPIIAPVAANGEYERIPPLYNTVKKWASYGTLGLFVVTVLFADVILSVFGESYVASREILYLLPVVYVAGALFGPCSALLTMTDRLKIEMGNGVLLVVLNVVLNVLFIPTYGGLGAALAVVVAGVVTNLAQVGAVYHIFGFHPFDRDHVGFIGVTAIVAIGTVFWGTSLPLLQRALVCVVLLVVLAALFYRQRESAERAMFDRVFDSW